VAAVFCVYSLVLLWSAFQSQQQLRLAADARLVADSKRRATALGDIVSRQLALARELAGLHELRTYQHNKALGMSPRYGLDASLEAVEQQLRQRLGSGQPGGDPSLRRVVFLDDTGRPVADTAAVPAAPVPAVGPAGDTGVTLDHAGHAVVVRAAVLFNGERSGTMVTFSDIGALTHSLLQLDGHGAYHETLIGNDGREIGTRQRPNQFSAEMAAALRSLPADQPTPIAALAAPGQASGGGDVIAVVAPVPGLPAVLVTTLTSGDIYGQLSSPWFLGSLSAFPVLLLLAALRTDALQRKAHVLELDAARTDAQRQFLQERNETLSREIQRRQAVEAELQGHRDRLEELVQQRSAELNRLFHALPDLYFRIARDGTILEHRAGRDADLLMAPELFLGRRMQEVMPADAAAILDQALDEVGQGAEQSVIEYGLVMAGGRRYFEARMLPLGEDQRVVVVRNVTERREFEELREANRREAERLARVKGEFLANMSHEIRTPLNAVLGLAQLGARGGGQHQAAEQFARIQEAGRHLLGIIDDILDLSKLEAGKLSVEQRPFCLAAAVEAAVRLVAGRTEVKGLGLHAELDDDLPPWVLGDALRLKQVLVNLLANAVKFTPKGDVVLSVSRAGTQLAFKVTDTGIGMDAAQMGRLFEPFQQADSSTTRRFGGTGLGLAISDNLVRLMGGSIAVESRPGVGSTFTVSLPLPTAEAPSATAAAGAVAPALRLVGLRVLAAEDAEVNRLVLESQLRHEGAQVLFVADGQAAVDAVAQAGPGAFDVVLMDVQMPVMDGMTATRHIREIAPSLPVIGLTAHALQEEHDRCLAAGMLERVVKPVDLDLLVAVVLRHVPRPVDTVHGDLTPS